MTCERCEELQERVFYLESELSLRSELGEIERVRRGLGVSHMQAKMMIAMSGAGGNPVSRLQLEDAMYGEDPTHERRFNTISVHIAHLRARLGGRDTILTAWGVGFQLPPEFQARVMALRAQP